LHLHFECGRHLSSSAPDEISKKRETVRKVFQRRFHARYVVAFYGFHEKFGRKDARFGRNGCPGVFVVFDWALVDARKLAVARIGHR
jgi:hypothetical protein